MGACGERYVDTIVDYHPRRRARHGCEYLTNEPGQLPVVQPGFADVNDVDTGHRSMTDEPEQAAGARRIDAAPIGDETDERAWQPDGH